jgi:serine/threonine protein kinase
MVLEAIAYLHTKKIAHRDVHPNNILVAHDEGQIRLIDFNVAKYYGPRSRRAHDQKKSALIARMITQTGNLFYCAPEVVSGGGYNEKVDMWSVGLVLYHMLYGSNPFAANHT